MRLFKKQKVEHRIEGNIGYFNLADWWLSTFNEPERSHIEATYKPLGISRSRPLTCGHVASTTQTAAGLLHGLAGWFHRPEDRSIARRILVKAEELAGSNILDFHFTYQSMIQTFYPDRDTDPSALEATIRACEKQIALAPEAASAFKREYRDVALPRHVGFIQLAIIREKQRDYAESIKLSREALKQGWAGDWEKRIARCESRLVKRTGG